MIIVADHLRQAKGFFITKTRKLENTKIFLASFRAFVIDLFVSGLSGLGSWFDKTANYGCQKFLAASERD